MQRAQLWYAWIEANTLLSPQCRHVRATIGAHAMRVGDQAALVSGGEAQRIIIARALLRHPKILILDEFTSALDVETEMAITHKVLEIMKGKTVIIISHRKSALTHCDQILRVGNGKVQLVDLNEWSEER